MSNQFFLSVFSFLSLPPPPFNFRCKQYSSTLFESTGWQRFESRFSNISNCPLLGRGSAKGRELLALTAFSLFCLLCKSLSYKSRKTLLQLGLAINHYLILCCSGKSSKRVVSMELRFLRMRPGRTGVSSVVRAPDDISKIKLYYSR